jgi:hypothetical protein
MTLRAGPVVALLFLFRIHSEFLASGKLIKFFEDFQIGEGDKKGAPQVRGAPIKFMV